MGSDLAQRAQKAADDATLHVLNGSQCVIVKSPPGAGKTTLVIRTAVAAYAVGAKRVVVACQTNSQATDLAKRILTQYDNSIRIHYFTRSKGKLPEELGNFNGRVVHCESVSKDLPENEPFIAIGTAAKWQWYDPTSREDYPADVLIVDEAWQLKFSTYMRIAPVAPQHFLVGDPGQIDPVVSSDMSLFEGIVDTHLPAPAVLERRRPDIVTEIQLPATRRLGAATTAIVSPSFYPRQPFKSLRPHIALTFDSEGTETTGVWERFVEGTEIVFGSVNEPSNGRFIGEVDEGLSATIQRLVSEVIAYGRIETDEGNRSVQPEDVGVVVAHRSQESAVKRHLGRLSRMVHVDTSERWQGLERDVMIVWHPVSGKSDLTEFARDAGRLCVMLSRHRAACVVVARRDTVPLIRSAGTGKERSVTDLDLAWERSRAHRTFLDYVTGSEVQLTV